MRTDHSDSEFTTPCKRICLSQGDLFLLLFGRYIRSSRNFEAGTKHEPPSDLGAPLFDSALQGPQLPSGKLAGAYSCKQ